jgi:hypothetical protein
MRQFFVALFSVLCTCSFAQQAKTLTPLDQSPMDMVYFPENYPILKIQNKAPAHPVMRVIYSRPHKGGRLIFGGLIDYGDVWRLGANEASEIEFFRDVRINKKLVKKGRYTMYVIPTPEKWTFIINSETDVWGAFKYSSAKDVLRMTVPVNKNDTTVENFTIDFTKTNFGALLNFYWDDVSASVPIDF